MRLEAPLLEASLIQRENRFRARVLLRGEEVAAHVPNSGRLTELFSPGQRVLVREAGAPHRVTDYDLLMVRLPQELVSVDARLPNKLFGEAVAAGTLAEFRGLKVEKREFVQGDSRLDFLLRNETSGGRCLVEVKSVTLVEDGVARFPDAVTKRGKRHLLELSESLSKGLRAAVVFVVQRGDARLFAPHWESDAEFGEQLGRVARDGVEVYAYGCQVGQQEIRLSSRIPVILSTGEGVGA